LIIEGNAVYSALKETLLASFSYSGKIGQAIDKLKSPNNGFLSGG
jgi:hypothetical protein